MEKMWLAFPNRENKLYLPHSQTAGTKFGIQYIEKGSGRRMEVPITIGPEKDVYLAHFDEDNVDFEITVDNSGSDGRDVGYDLGIHGKRHRFVQQYKTSGTLKTLKTNGRKLHFMKQSGDEGEQLVGAAAGKYGMTYGGASEMVSRIKFDVQVSRQPPMKICVIGTDEEKLTLFVSCMDTIEDVKSRACGRTGDEPIEHRLICQGKILPEKTTVEENNIREGTEMHLVPRSVGGGGCPCQVGRKNSGDHTTACRTATALGLEFQLEIEKQIPEGELGMICLGEKCDQQFISANFTQDTSISIPSFVIELRLVSRYKLL